MTYNEFEQLMSPVRLAKFRAACGNDTRKALKLYRGNTRLSGAMLAVLGMFEVVLRNKIDTHYKAQFPSAPGAPEWLLAATLPGGFLTANGCHNSLMKINQEYTSLGIRYTHDRLVAALSFGFWKYLFKGHQYMAGGNTLLQILPNRPPHTNQGAVLAKLDKINDIRNRVAHHEPICFDTHHAISTAYARAQFQAITDLLQWMDVNAGQLFRGVDGVIKEVNFIDGI